MRRLAAALVLIPSLALAQTVTNYNTTATTTNNNVQSGTATNINQNTDVSTSTVNQSVNSTTASTVNSTNLSTNRNYNDSTSTNLNTNRNFNDSTSSSTATNTNISTSDSTATNLNTNVSTSDSTSMNTNINQSTSVSTNVNQSTSASTSENKNISVSDSNSTSKSTQNVSQKIVSPPPSAIAPSMMSYSQDLCTTGISGAVQTQILGISAGKTVRDKNCEALKLSKTLYDMGMRVAAVSLLCQDDRVYDAMKMAGTPCPYEGKIGKEAAAAWEENKPLRSSRR